MSSTPHTAIIVSQLNNWLTFTTSGFNFVYAVILRLLICFSPLSSVRAVIKSREPGIECGLQLLLSENRRNIEPKEIPSCLIPYLLVVSTWQLEILLTTLTGSIIGALFASGIYHVAQNFPVTTEDELVITGKEIKNEAKSQGFELEGPQHPSQADMQTQTPYELKTTV